MKTNIAPTERLIRVIFGAVILYAAYAFFQNHVARILAALGGLFTLGEGLLGVCYLQTHLGMRTMIEGARKDPILGFLLVQLVFAYEWWGSGWEKVANPEFVSGLSKTLAAFASQNPFPWYKDFLTGFAIPNVDIFSALVTWGSLAIGVALFGTAAIYAYTKDAEMRRYMLVIALLTLIGGLFLNANYYLAAAWTGPGTRGVNVAMFWVQAVMVYLYSSRLAERR